ncbi:bis(5'-nucleosyl)-tetraphosphatase (symmetrical) YqeK [Mesoaciditoga sp.]
MITKYERVIERLREYRKYMVSRQRAAHIQRMEEDAVKLSEIHNLDLEKILVAVCAHDLFRDVKGEKLLKVAKIWKINVTQEERSFPLLLHGKVASEFLKRRFDVKDQEILDAVAFHTSGMATNSRIVKALVVLDTLEHGRNFPGVDTLRECAKRSLDDGYKGVIKNKIKYALDNDFVVLVKSVETWNYMKGVFEDEIR